MIRALWRSRLLLVTAVLGLLSAIPLAALPLLHLGDHPACDSPVAMDHGSAHHLGNGDAARDDAQHCVVCHWSQWVRAIQEEAPSMTPSTDRGPVATPYIAQPRTTAASGSFARAPPFS